MMRRKKRNIKIILITINQQINANNNNNKLFNQNRNKMNNTSVYFVTKINKLTLIAKNVKEKVIFLLILRQLNSLNKLFKESSKMLLIFAQINPNNNNSSNMQFIMEFHVMVAICSLLSGTDMFVHNVKTLIIVKYVRTVKNIAILCI